MSRDQIAALVALVIGVGWIVFVCLPLAAAACRIILRFWGFQ